MASQVAVPHCFQLASACALHWDVGVRTCLSVTHRLVDVKFCTRIEILSWYSWCSFCSFEQPFKWKSCAGVVEIPKSRSWAATSRNQLSGEPAICDFIIYSAAAIMHHSCTVGVLFIHMLPKGKERAPSVYPLALCVPCTGCQ